MNIHKYGGSQYSEDARSKTLTVEEMNVCICCAGNGSKSAGAADADNDDEHISLAPQRSSFLSGCQVKRSAAGQDSKRDG